MSRTATRKPIAKRSRSKRPAEPKRLRTARADADPESKAKVSVTVGVRELLWANETAAKRGIPVSTIFQEALESLHRRSNLRALLEEVGGTEDVTEADIESVRNEYRAAGLKP